MNYDQKNFSRRKLLKIIVYGSTIPFIGTLTNTAAAAKTSKELVKYQDTPNENKKCSDCMQFIPGEISAEGKCKVVEGSISPQGWCTAFAPKS